MINRFRIRHNRSRAKILLDQATMKLNAALDRGVQPIPARPSAPVTACFVVGCGNSGTTLLAARLGNHPQALVIPQETSMFLPLGRRLSRAREKMIAAMEEARANGATCLVEKTPKHVQSIDRIRRLLPDSRVIVVMRNPFDTCLSIKKRFGDLDYGIGRWVIDNEAALALAGQPLTDFVFYESLTANPDGELTRLLGFLGLPFDPVVVTSTETAYGGTEHRSPTMKLRAEQVAQPIRANSGKWREELSAEETDRVWKSCGGLWLQLLDAHPDLAPDDRQTPEGA